MKEPLVHIGILEEKAISIVFSGGYKHSETDKAVWGEFKAVIESGKLILKGKTSSFNSAGEVIFDPAEFDSDSFLLKDVRYGKNFHWEKKENQRFRGSLKLKISGQSILAINIIPAEDYLASVISSEMSSESPMELLKAHAIISRSWLMNIIERNNRTVTDSGNSESVIKTSEEIIKWYGSSEHMEFHVCGDDHCQRYHGINKVISGDAYTAVERTRGLVLKHHQKICDTRYSKCCGGITENYENVWDPAPKKYLSSIFDYKYEQEGFKTDLTVEQNAVKWIKENPPAFCNTPDNKIISNSLVGFDRSTTDFYRWKVVYSQEEISLILKEKSGIDFGDIIDLIPVERGKSGRLIKLRITGSKKTMTIGRELEIRRVLSKTHLYSSAIAIEKEYNSGSIPSRFTIYGAGWGHGVGLCQIGAAVMSAKGYWFDEILLHYYREAEISKVY